MCVCVCNNPDIPNNGDMCSFSCVWHSVPPPTSQLTLGTDQTHIQQSYNLHGKIFYRETIRESFFVRLQF